MIKTFVTLLALLFIFSLPGAAKGPTLKITIEGTNLPRSVDIKDPGILQQFNIWTGPGTSSNEAKSFVVDWAMGIVTDRPIGLQQYRVLFYADHGSGLRQPAYVVSYEYDEASGRGYVYLPGNGEESYDLNVRSIYRRVEGNWFHASDQWNTLATSLLTRLLNAGSSEK
jgi:hypothetical protein